jgi:fucose permease
MSKRKPEMLLIALAFAAFVSLGLPDGLNGVAWPSIRAYFDLPLDALGSLLVMFTLGYLVSSFSSGRLLSLMSVGKLLAMSCLATAMSMLGYALASAWWVMVTFAALAGLGAGAVDAGLNTFAAMRFSARMVNWLHACYGIGAATGPMIMTSVLTMHRPWQRGYVIVGIGQLALALCFLVTRQWWPGVLAASTSPATVTRASNISTLKLPAVWLSVGVFFVYTGIEAAAGAWAFTLFTEARGVSVITAGWWVSAYWGALTVGRLLSGMVLGFVSVHRLLRLCFAGIASGAILVWLSGASGLAVAGLVLMGLASAPVFPSLIASTPRRLGSVHATNAVGFQVSAAVLGQSLLPALIGLTAGRFGLEVVGPSLFFLALLLIILYFSLTIPGWKIARNIRTALASLPIGH